MSSAIPAPTIEGLRLQEKGLGFYLMITEEREAKCHQSHSEWRSTAPALLSSVVWS